MNELREQLEAAGLGEYVAVLERDRVDLQLLRRLAPEMVEELCKDWPWGDRERMRNFCASLRSEPTKAAAPIESASSTSPTTPTVPLLTAPFDEDLIANLPLIIARPLAGLLAAKDADRVVRQSVQVVEVTTRFLGLICQADYYSHPKWFDVALNLAIDSKLRRPSLGHWIEFVRESIASAARAHVDMFLQQLPDAWAQLDQVKRHANVAEAYDELGRLTQRAGKLSTLDWLVSARNAYAHEKRSHDDVEAARLFRDMTCELVRGLVWIRQYELWSVERSQNLRLRGLEPIEEPSAPRVSLDAGPCIVLRRRAVEARDGGRVLELPPLVISERTIKADGRAGEPVLYNGLGRNVVSYTPVASGASAIETPRTSEEYRRQLARKQFQRLSRAELNATELLLRIRSATKRSIQILFETAKYRPQLHYVRSGCESVLEPWINSPKPLLGIEARAGAGKTSLLASLVERRWTQVVDGPPVLFLLARDFETSSIERVLRQALVLDDDVSLDHLCGLLVPQLVVVIDGLNEHKLRSDLLEGIVSAAERTSRSGIGPRFAISWRDEDRGWIAPKLKQRDLWWVPAERMQKCFALSFRAAAPRVEGGDKESKSNPDASMSAARAIASAPTEPDRDPCFKLPQLSDAELSKMWDLYREQDPESSSPRFSFVELQKRNAVLANELRNPLDMRIALELYDGRELGEVILRSLYEDYLDSLRGKFAACGDLLELLAGLLMEAGSSTVHEYAIAERNPSLVNARGPISALDYLERLGVVTIRTERNEKLVGFTNERIAEQAIGERLASNVKSEDPEFLARWIDQMTALGFVLARGSARCALAVLVEKHGLSYLTQFVDHQPDGVESIAGRLLATIVMRGSEFEAARIAHELVAEQTEGDLAVASEAALALWHEDEISLEYAFLQPLQELAIERSVSSPWARELCLETEDVLRRRDEEGEASKTEESDTETADQWNDRVATHWRAHGLWSDLSRLLNRRANRCFDAQRYTEAHTFVVEALQAARTVKERRRIAFACQTLARTLSKLKRHPEALAAFEQGLDEAKYPELLEEWSLAASKDVLADIHRAAGRPSEAAEVQLECADLEREDGNLFSAVCSISMASNDLLMAGMGEQAREYSLKMLEVASEEGSRRMLALANEWHGDKLREQSQHEEALEFYRKAIEAGSLPEQLEDWSPTSSWAESAKCHKALGRIDDALAAEEQVLAFELQETNFGNASRACARIASLLITLNRIPEALASSIRSVELATQSCDRRALALANEWHGDKLREQSQHEEALEFYRKAIEAGSVPDQVEDWSPASPWFASAKCHEALGRIEDALAAEEQVLEFELQETNFGYASRACSRIASLLITLKRMPEALTSSVRSVELATQSGDRRALALANEWHGDKLREQSQHEEALEFYRKAIEAGSVPDQVEDWSPSSPWKESAKCHEALGRIEDALAAEEQVLEFELEESDLDNAAMTCLRVADLLITLERIPEALAKSERGRELSRALVEELSTPERQRGVSMSLEKVADIAQMRGDLDAARAGYAESLLMSRALAQELGTLVSRRDVVEGLNRVAGIEKERGDLDVALAKYAESLEISRELLETSGSASDCNGVVWSVHLSANCNLERGNAVEAMNLVKHSDDAVRLESECEGDPNYLDTCAAYWETRAKAASVLNDVECSRESAARGAEIRARIERIKSGESGDGADA